MPKKYQEVKDILASAGWTVLRRSSGSHEQWISPDGNQRVTIASGGGRIAKCRLAPSLEPGGAMTDYLVIYEQASDGSWSASAADLPVFPVGDTRAEAEGRMREAIAFHVECIRQDGLAVPVPTGTAGVVSI